MSGLGARAIDKRFRMLVEKNGLSAYSGRHYMDLKQMFSEGIMFAMEELIEDFGRPVKDDKQLEITLD